MAAVPNTPMADPNPAVRPSEAVREARGFDPGCERCPRLRDLLAQVRAEHPDYHGRPVAPFGDPVARLLIVGLAPGMHGANRSGRPFTGDFAGILLYRTLHAHGFASGPESIACDDGLVLTDCRVTNAVKCLPPQNKPSTEEIRNCNGFLGAELDALPDDALILSLGLIAHNAVLRSRGLKQSQWRFAHGAEHRLPGGLLLLDSYHCSRYNTQTRRLTPAMFDAVLARCRVLLRPSEP